MLGPSLSSWALPELIEAAAKSKHPELARASLERLDEATHAAGTDWALGISARCRALLGEGNAANNLYCEAIHRLSRTRLPRTLRVPVFSTVNG